MLFSISILAFSCKSEECKHDKDEECTEHHEKDHDCDGKHEHGNDTNCEEFHWGYEGDEAPENWGTCFATCSGTSQSPINISNVVEDGELSQLQFTYNEVPITLLNNGHTLQFEYGNGSNLILDGEEYELLQFHFHTGSEHTIDGKQYAMEVHLVHQNKESGNIAVIGVLYKEGAENEFLQKFIENLPKEADDVYKAEDVINAKDLLPADQAYYTYSGSLTTPPCSEIVTWFVMQEPIEASAEQIEKMHSIMHDNFRPIQEVNEREIKAFN